MRPSRMAPLPVPAASGADKPNRERKPGKKPATPVIPGPIQWMVWVGNRGCPPRWLTVSQTAADIACPSTSLAVLDIRHHSHMTLITSGEVQLSSICAVLPKNRGVDSSQRLQAMILHPSCSTWLLPTASAPHHALESPPDRSSTTSMHEPELLPAADDTPSEKLNYRPHISVSSPSS